MGIVRATRDQRGMGVLAIPFTLTVLFLIGAIIFGGWAYTQMLNYRNNANAIASSAADQAKQQEATAKDNEYAEKDKSPLRSYKGPAPYGSVTIQYPKTWSAYVVDDRNGSPYIDGYFYPNTVPDTQSPNSAFALRVQVVQDSYSSVLTQAADGVSQHTTTVIPYSAPKVSGVVGVKIDGTIPGQKNGSMVVFPLRNMTLEIWTESPDFQGDFTNYILPNFSFAP